MPRFVVTTTREGPRAFTTDPLKPDVQFFWSRKAGIPEGPNVWILPDGTATLDQPGRGLNPPHAELQSEFFPGGHDLPEDLSLEKARVLATVVDVWDCDTESYVRA